MVNWSWWKGDSGGPSDTNQRTFLTTMDWRSLNCITHLLQPEIKIILFFLMMVAIFREKSMKFLESWLLYHFWLVQKNDKVLSHDGCRLQKRVWNFWKAGCIIILGWCKRAPVLLQNTGQLHVRGHFCSPLYWWCTRQNSMKEKQM